MTIFERGIEFIRQAGIFLEAHNGAISAVSAALVAAFTFTLWRATTRLWRTALEHARHLERSVGVAEESASVLPVLERAYVFMFTELEISSTHTRGKTIFTLAVAKCELANHGKTPAIIKAICFGFSVVDEQTMPLEYPPSFTDSEIVIPSGGAFPESTPGVYSALTPEYQVEHAEPNVASIQISATQSNDIAEGKRFLILLARATYLDVFNREHETATCRIYDGRTRTFAEHGGGKYNYRT